MSAPAERNHAANIVLHDAARQIRNGHYLIVSRPDKTAHAVWDDAREAEFTRLMLSCDPVNAPPGKRHSKAARARSSPPG